MDIVNLYRKINRFGLNPFPTANALARVAHSLPITRRNLFDTGKLSGAIILLYHEIGVERFEEHIRYLLNFEIVPLDNLLEQMQDSASQGKLAITFDDGWKTNYELLPVIENYQIPVTIYAISSLIGTDNEVWTRTVKSMLKGGRIREIPDLQHFKTLPYEERTEEIAQWLALTGYKPKERTMLSIVELKTMLASGLVTIGSHGSIHESLLSLPGERVNFEISQSKAELKRKLGIEIEHFAYPFGKHNATHIRILKEAGYKSAVIDVPGINNSTTNPFELKRVMISKKMSWHSLVFLLARQGND